MNIIKERTKEVAIFERLLQTAIYSKVETRNTNWDNFFNFREKHPELKKLSLLIGTDETPVDGYNRIVDAKKIWS